MKLITQASPNKLRGGFYTPPAIARFLLKWGINGSKESDILEPSCGDGVFLREIAENNYTYKSITAIELDHDEYQKAKKVALNNTKVINQDFHTFCNLTKTKYDLIIGNPPYIRFQFFDRDEQLEAATIFEKAGLTYSKLTNAWVSFVVGSTLLLKDKGKIAFVLPAEILQVSYALQLRKYLALTYNKINIISFEKLVFPDIQQEVVLLLCEKDGTNEHNIDHLELNDASQLDTLDVRLLKHPKKTIDFKSNKWTFYFLNQEEIDFLESVADKFLIKTLAHYCNVEVGITTGSNEFFTVPLSLVKEYDLSKYAKPMVGRSVQVKSVVFDKEDWLINKKADVKAHLLVFPPKEKLLNVQGAKNYIQKGEKQGIHKGYKTSLRKDWFVVPSIKVSEALFIRRNNRYPRLIINKAKAYTTDTMHRVFIKPDVNINALVASYYNSLSLAFSEVTGRSHGGGVLELMPNEAEKILLPYCNENEDLLLTIDTMLRDKKDIEDILKITNEIILKKNYDLSDYEISLAHGIWKKLSARRLNRS